MKGGVVYETVFLCVSTYMKLIFKNVYFTVIAIIFPVLIGGIYGYTAYKGDASVIRTAFCRQ